MSQQTTQVSPGPCVPPAQGSASGAMRTARAEGCFAHRTHPGAMRTAHTGVQRPLRGARVEHAHCAGGSTPGATDAHTGTRVQYIVPSTGGSRRPHRCKSYIRRGQSRPLRHRSICRGAKMPIACVQQCKRVGLRQHSGLSHLRVLSRIPRRVRTHARCNRRILSQKPNHSGTAQMLAPFRRMHVHIGLERLSSLL